MLPAEIFTSHSDKVYSFVHKRDNDWAELETAWTPALPVGEPQRLQDKRNEESPVWLRSLMFGLVGGGAMGLGCSLAWLPASTPGAGRQQAVAFTVFTLAMLIVSALYYLGPGVLRKFRPEIPLTVAMPRGMDVAWQMWQNVVAKLNELDPVSDATAAVNEQDPALRRGLCAYLDHDLSQAQRTEFEAWFLQTCTDANDLLKAELHRAELMKNLDQHPAILEAVSSPSRLSQAQQDSEDLTATVQAVLDRNDELVSRDA